MHYLPADDTGRTVGEIPAVVAKAPSPTFWPTQGGAEKAFANQLDRPSKALTQTGHGA
jgi:hypothetical protein